MDATPKSLGMALKDSGAALKQFGATPELLGMALKGLGAKLKSFGMTPRGSERL